MIVTSSDVPPGSGVVVPPAPATSASAPTSAASRRFSWPSSPTPLCPQREGRFYRVSPPEATDRIRIDTARNAERPAIAGLSGWSQPGSNRRPSGCQPDALPAELWPLGFGIVALAPATRLFPQRCPQVSADVPTDPWRFSTGESQLVPPMFQIGASLREARTRRGLSPADVQKAIRIRERYLTALEEEKWDLLPGEAYAKGFLRTYAEFLGLDGDLYLDEWNSRFGHPDEVPAPEPPPRERRLGLLRPVLAGLLIAVAIAGAAAWRLGSDGKTVHTTSTSTARTAAPAPVRKPPASVPAAPVYAVFRAVRGNCWLLVRRSTAVGTRPLRADAGAGNHTPAPGRPRRPLGPRRRAVEPRPLGRRTPRHRTADRAGERARLEARDRRGGLDVVPESVVPSGPPWRLELPSHQLQGGDPDEVAR